MLIAIADDERSFADDLGRFVHTSGYQSMVFYSLEDAWNALMRAEEPFVLVLDHDFGSCGGPWSNGYELCERLRVDHAFGLFLPIIYLTGRETERGFLRRLATKPHFGPTMFITKDQLAADPGLLRSVLTSTVEALGRLQNTTEAQAARQALIAFGKALPEDADEA